MKSICIKPKTHEEWLANRMSGIGSSDVATILGLNPFSTPYQLWRQRMEPGVHENSNEAMLLGHLLEDAIAQRWAIATGKEIIKSSAEEWMYIHPEKDYFRASPDRIYWDEKGSRKSSNRCILEIKSTQKDIDPDDFPKYWFAQVQWQLYVMGLEKANLAWLTRGRDFGFIEITKNDDLCGYIAQEVEKFWTDNIIGGQEPALISAADVMTKFTSSTADKVSEVSQEIYADYLQIKDVKAQIEALEGTKKKLEENIKLYLQDAEALSYNGKTIATWKSSKPSQKFDSNAFAYEHPDLYRDYIKETPGSRRFVIK